MGNAELAAIMGKNENYNAMMEDTVNGLILKVHRLNFRKIDETFGAVLEKAAFLDRFLAELGVDSEDEDYDGILSDISERYRILCDQMQECRGDIFAARDIAARMMPRFPRSESNLAQLAEGVLLKNERYNRIAIKLAELGKKIRH
jgi:hypothetical protein